MKTNRLPGHTLLFEGKLLGIYERNSNGPGVTKCSCGQTSPVLPSTGARKRWHRAHKDTVRAAQT